MRDEKFLSIAEAETAKGNLSGQRDARAAPVAQFLPWRSSGLLVGALVSVPLLIYGALLSEETRATFIAEHGVVENSTVVAYGVLILALFAVFRDDPKFFASSAAVVALAIARELDLHKAFTTGSLTKLNTYTGDTPPMEKLIAAGVMIVLGLFLVWYVAKYAARWWCGLRFGHSAAYSVLTALCLLATAKIFDSFARVYRDVTGVAIHTGTWLDLLEEVFELAAPLVLLWAVGQYAAQRSPGTPLHRPAA